MMSCTSSIGLALDVSTICTGTAGGGGCGGEETAVSGLPGSCVMVGAAGAVPPGSSFFSSSTVSDSFVNAPPFGSLEGVHLGHDVLLVFGQLRRQIDQLPGEHPARRAEAGEDQRHHHQHRRDAANPALDARDQRREQKGEQRRRAPAE